MRVNNRVEYIKQLGCDTDLGLAYEHLEHQLEGDRALLVQRYMDRCCLFTRCVQLWIAMKEYER